MKNQIFHATGMKMTIGNRVIHNTIDPWTAKDLLMIKHLFYASLAGKVDYRSFLRTIGLYEVPESLDGLNKLSMTDSAIHGVRTCYKATRRVEQVDPLGKMPYKLLLMGERLRKTMSGTATAFGQLTAVLKRAHKDMSKFPPIKITSEMREQ